jgi:hypothetical protein
MNKNATRSKIEITLAVAATTATTRAIIKIDCMNGMYEMTSGGTSTTRKINHDIKMKNISFCFIILEIYNWNACEFAKTTTTTTTTKEEGRKRNFVYLVQQQLLRIDTNKKGRENKERK